MKLTNIITERVQETYFEEFKSWWMEKRNNDEDPINIEFDIEGVDFKRSLRNAIDVEVPGHIFFILSKLWEMWGTDSGNEQILNTIEDRHEFGKKLMFLMRKNDFVFDKEAMGAKTAVDRQDKDAFQKEYPDVGLNEKKIGFNRGPEYSEEAEDLLDDFAKSTEMINKELKKKIVDSEDPKVQEILNLLDDNLDPEFIDDLEAVYNLIQELPDKPTDKPKVGFKQSLNEQNWEQTYDGSINPDYPLWDGSYLNDVTYFQECSGQDNVDFTFNLNGYDYDLSIDTSFGVTYWDQDGDGEADPPPQGYMNAMGAGSTLGYGDGINLSLLMEYMMGNSSMLNDYTHAEGPMGGVSLTSVTEDYIQVNNAGELFAFVYPNLLGSLSIEDGTVTINSNAFSVNPVVTMLLPDFATSVTFTTVGELQTLIEDCIGESNEIEGCTDPNASNYNSNATIDDGSCTYVDGINWTNEDLLSCCELLDADSSNNEYPSIQWGGIGLNQPGYAAVSIPAGNTDQEIWEEAGGFNINPAQYSGLYFPSLYPNFSIESVCQVCDDLEGLGMQEGNWKSFPYCACCQELGSAGFTYAQAIETVFGACDINTSTDECIPGEVDAPLLVGTEFEGCSDQNNYVSIWGGFEWAGATGSFCTALCMNQMPNAPLQDVCLECCGCESFDPYGVGCTPNTPPCEDDVLEGCDWFEAQEDYDACCTKCQTGVQPEDPCHAYCECCDPIPLKWKCSAGGVCVSAPNETFPYETENQCYQAGCGYIDPFQEQICELFGSQPQQEQDLICYACGNGGSFEATLFGSPITITLPEILMDSCACCPQGMGLPSSDTIDPNKAKQTISKLEKLFQKAGKQVDDPEVQKLKRRAGIKKK